MHPSTHRIAACWLNSRGLTAAARGVADLPPGTYVSVDVSGNEIRAFFTDAFGDDMGVSPKGTVEVYGPGSDTGPCLNAFIVGRAFVDSGWGPLLYDVVMELAGNRGLTPDRAKVSPDAERVWHYYMHNRSGIQVKQLDFPPRSPHHLTDTPKDDCEIARPITTPSGLEKSPLGKVYYAKGTPTLRALEQAGKLVRI